MAKKRFRREVLSAGRGGHTIALDDEVVRALEGRAHTRVKGTINGAPYRSSIFPYGGVFYLGVHKATMEAAGARVGDAVDVVIERDESPRQLELPDDLRKAIRRGKGLQAEWDGLSFSHQREYTNAVAEAKKPETRARRIQQTIGALIERRERKAGNRCS